MLFRSKKAFPDDDVIVVHDAHGGKPIKRWYKKWKLPQGATNTPTDREQKNRDAEVGDLYDTMMAAVKKALGDKRPVSVAFVWMQGESDAKYDWQSVYYEALRGTVEQIRTDLKHQEIAVVIGRLSGKNNGEKGWDAIRAIQEKVATDESLGAWVDTDKIERAGDNKKIHYSEKGYAELGKQFADKAIELIQKGKAK